MRQTREDRLDTVEQDSEGQEDREFVDCFKHGFAIRE